MKVLIVHQNFPGQYKHLVRHLGETPGNDVVFITQRKQLALPGVRKVVYQPSRKVSPQIHRCLREPEEWVLNAEAVLRVARALKQEGFVPDVILGHNGWGEIWFLKDVFPHSPLIGYFEFFYRMHGADIGFDPYYPVNLDTVPIVHTKNFGNLLGLDSVDLGQCPTQWQKSLYPKRYQSMLHVIHEGIDTEVLQPDPAARVTVLARNHELAAGDEIVTYVSYNLEAYRGFPTFMRSLPEILRRRPRAHVLVAGGDLVSYGAQLPKGKTFREEMLKELDGSLDLSRVHFLGPVPYGAFVKMLQVSRVHVYLTCPFVLSWSMMEAMAAGCLIVGSRTPPVEEMIQDCQNGLLVDFFSPQQVADRVVEALEDRRVHDSIRQNARQTIVDNYDLKTICLPAHLRLIESVARRRGALSTA